MWIVNSADNTVTALRARDGSLVDTYPVGLTPRSVAFDGRLVWVANSGENSVSVLETNGSLIKTITTDVIPTPYSLAFDGTYMWVTSGIVSKASVIYTARSSLNVVKIVLGSSGQQWTGIAFDGHEIWIVANNLSIIQTATYGSGLTSVGYRSFHVGSAPLDIAFDGANLWVANFGDNTVSKR